MPAVKIRVCGDLHGIAEAVRVLHIAALAEGFQIPEKSGLYPNRREPGYRVYITLRFPADEDTEPRRAAHRRQAIRRPAAPSRRHLP